MRKSSRLAKWLPQCLFGEVAQGLGDELAVLVEIFHPLGDDGRVDTVHIDLAHAAAGNRLGNAGRFVNDGLIVARFRRYGIIFVIGGRHVIGRDDRIAVAGFVYLHRFAVEIRIGEMTGRGPKVHQGEVELAGILMYAGAATNDLLELGHGADFAVEHDKPAGLDVDTGRKEPRCGDQHGVSRFRVDEVAQLPLAFGVGAGNAHNVPVVLFRQIGVLVDERLAHAGGVFLVDTEDDRFLKSVSAFLQERRDFSGPRALSARPGPASGRSP